jgi:3-hydroxybutyryl-CoA dehydrogenase
MAQKIEKVGVLGAGLMGHGIAQVAAQAGYQVVLREVDDATLAEGDRQDREAARARGREGQVHPGGRGRDTRARIHGSTDYGDLADCDLVIEAITENLPLKLEMWKEVDAIVKGEACSRRTPPRWR